MSEETKPRAELEGEEKSETKEEQEAKAGKKPVSSPLEQLSILCKGTFKLMQPIRARGEDVTELEFDMCALTGMEIVEALDASPINNMFAISNEQALAVFAASAAKCAPKIEDGYNNLRLYNAKDIIRGIGAVDCVKAVQRAKLFYNASSQAGNKNISNG